MPLTLPTDYRSPLLVQADCLDTLAQLPTASIDAIVQDPPAGIGFMGRDWDDKRGYQPRTERGREVMAGTRLLGLEPWAAGFVAFMFEVAVAQLRVVKPGAHSLSWALPRTADLTMLALRLAGWEIRDSLVHLFGGGFPKSLDVSKAIDKMHGAEREQVPATGGLHKHRMMNDDGWSKIGADAPTMDSTAPATDDAKRHAGKGTALSPGHELWILARAPMAGTVARNVLAHGTGAINVDACRTPTDGERVQASAGPLAGYSGSDGAYERGAGWQARPEGHGRWPKNALLSCALACEGDRHSPGCPVAELDRQSGDRRSAGDYPTTYSRSEGYGGGIGLVQGPLYGDAGGASRFFPRFGYHPKASDRTVPGRPDLENKHPTHKHPELMRWLIRLITPADGIVLDAFMGSGTTGVAAVAERVRFIGVERDPIDVAKARIEYAAAADDPDAYSPKRAAKRKTKRRKKATA